MKKSFKQIIKEEQENLPVGYAFLESAEMPRNKNFQRKVPSDFYHTRLRSVYPHFKPISKIVIINKDQ